MARGALTAVALLLLAVSAAARAAGRPDPAADPETASAQDAAAPADLQDLQYDLENLDEMLQTVDTSDPRYPELQQRVDWLREDLRRLEARLRQPGDERRPEVSQEQVQRLRATSRRCRRTSAGRTSAGRRT